VLDQMAAMGAPAGRWLNGSFGSSGKVQTGKCFPVCASSDSARAKASIRSRARTHKSNETHWAYVCLASDRGARADIPGPLLCASTTRHRHHPLPGHSSGDHGRRQDAPLLGA
jgi:hypothetical protein